MSWLRDIFKALGWAIAAAAISITLGLSGVVSGPLPALLPLVAAPILAYRWHKSGRLAGLVAAWLVVLVAAGVLLLLWDLQDFKFRAIQG